MNLKERIQSLIGHEVIINAPEDCAFYERDDETEETLMCDHVNCEGLLEEIGDDYILVKALDKEKGGVATTGTEYFASLEWVGTITHIRDCKKCVVDSALGSTTKKTN